MLIELVTGTAALVVDVSPSGSVSSEEPTRITFDKLALRFAYPSVNGRRAAVDFTAAY